MLKELPEELRNEIIKEYGLEFKVKESSSAVVPKVSKNKPLEVEPKKDTDKQSKCFYLWKQTMILTSFFVA